MLGCWWFSKYVTKFSESPNLSPNTQLILYDSRAWRWCSDVDHQPQLVLQAQVTQQSISNLTPPDFEEFKTGVLPSWVANPSATMSRMELGMWNTGQESESLSHELWCDHVLNIKHSKSFCRSSYAMHVSGCLLAKCWEMVESHVERHCTWLFQLWLWDVKRDAESEDWAISYKLNSFNLNFQIELYIWTFNLNSQSEFSIWTNEL